MNKRNKLCTLSVIKPNLHFVTHTHTNTQLCRACFKAKDNDLCRRSVITWHVNTPEDKDASLPRRENFFSSRADPDVNAMAAICLGVGSAACLRWQAGAGVKQCHQLSSWFLKKQKGLNVCKDAAGETHAVAMTPHWLSLASRGVVVPVSSPWLQVGDLM